MTNTIQNKVLILKKYFFLIVKIQILRLIVGKIGMEDIPKPTQFADFITLQ